MMQLYVYEGEPFDKVWASGHVGWLEHERWFVESCLIVRKCRSYNEDYLGQTYRREQRGRPDK